MKEFKKGFTLVELLVVLAIMAIVGAVAAPGIMSKINDARAGQIAANTSSLLVAIDAEVTSALDSDFVKIANIDNLKKNKRIKTSVQKSATLTTDSVIPGPWSSEITIGSISDGDGYYVGIVNLKSKPACIAISNLFRKKATMWKYYKATKLNASAMTTAIAESEVRDATPATAPATANVTGVGYPNNDHCADGSGRFSFLATFE